jgi:tetratricopeptide (TPR) repeat protein
MVRCLVLAAVLAAPAALACSNAMEEEGSFFNPVPGEKDLLSANRKFANKDYAGAFADAEEAMSEATPNGVTYGPGAQTGYRARLIAGQAALHLGRFADAEKYLREAGDSENDRPHFRARLAEARVGLKRFNEARPVLEQLAGKDLLPDGAAWKALAVARAAGGDVEGARAAETEAQRRGGAEPYAIPWEPPTEPGPTWPLWTLAALFAVLGAAVAKKLGWILTPAPQRS